MHKSLFEESHGGDEEASRPFVSPAAGGPAEKTFQTLVGLEMRPRRLREAAWLWSELERVREYFPDVKPDAFAQRWLDTLTTGRPVIDIGQFRRVQQAFSKPTTPQLASQILSARA